MTTSGRKDFQTGRLTRQPSDPKVGPESGLQSDPNTRGLRNPEAGPDLDRFDNLARQFLLD